MKISVWFYLQAGSRLVRAYPPNLFSIQCSRRFLEIRTTLQFRAATQPLTDGVFPFFLPDTSFHFSGGIFGS